MVTGKQLVSRCLAWRNLAGQGAIGRTVVAVGSPDGTQPVSLCTDPGLRAGRGRLRLLHKITLNSFTQMSGANSHDGRARCVTPRPVCI